MTFTWTRHRFSGGALALDVANSVILRFDPARRIDRYVDPAAIDGFAEAANMFCIEAPRFRAIEAVAAERHAPFIALRETADRHFRAVVQKAETLQTLADLLDAIAAVLRQQERPTSPERLAAGKSASVGLDAATAYSALTLSADTRADRLKICPNCEWLFLDRSRNRSRTWCDMTVCGNRIKAGRHYRKQKGDVSP